MHFFGHHGHKGPPRGPSSDSEKAMQQFEETLQGSAQAIAAANQAAHHMSFNPFHRHHHEETSQRGPSRGAPPAGMRRESEHALHSLGAAAAAALPPDEAESESLFPDDNKPSLLKPDFFFKLVGLPEDNADMTLLLDDVLVYATGQPLEFHGSRASRGMDMALLTAQLGAGGPPITEYVTVNEGAYVLVKFRPRGGGTFALDILQDEDEFPEESSDDDDDEDDDDDDDDDDNATAFQVAAELLTTLHDEHETEKGVGTGTATPKATTEEPQDQEHEPGAAAAAAQTKKEAPAVAKQQQRHHSKPVRQLSKDEVMMTAKQAAAKKRKQKKQEHKERVAAAKVIQRHLRVHADHARLKRKLRMRKKRERQLRHKRARAKTREDAAAREHALAEKEKATKKQPWSVRHAAEQKQKREAALLAKQRKQEAALLAQQEDSAATRLERLYRGHHDRAVRAREAAREEEAAERVERILRGYHARMEISRTHEQEEAAAVALQGLYRGHKARAEVEALRRETESAALSLEQMYRAHRARGQRKHLQEEQAHDREERAQEKAATNLEQMYRAHRARVELDRLKAEEEAAIKLEGLFRGHRGRANLDTYRKDAVLRRYHRALDNEHALSEAAAQYTRQRTQAASKLEHMFRKHHHHEELEKEPGGNNETAARTKKTQEELEEEAEAAAKQEADAYEKLLGAMKLEHKLQDYVARRKQRETDRYMPDPSALWNIQEQKRRDEGGRPTTFQGGGVTLGASSSSGKKRPGGGEGSGGGNWAWRTSKGRDGSQGRRTRAILDAEMRREEEAARLAEQRAISRIANRMAGGGAAVYQPWREPEFFLEGAAAASASKAEAYAADRLLRDANGDDFDASSDRHRRRRDDRGQEQEQAKQTGEDAEAAAATTKASNVDVAGRGLIKEIVRSYHSEHGDEEDASAGGRGGDEPGDFSTAMSSVGFGVSTIFGHVDRLAHQAPFSRGRTERMAPTDTTFLRNDGVLQFTRQASTPPQQQRNDSRSAVAGGGVSGGYVPHYLATPSIAAAAEGMSSFSTSVSFHF